MRIAMVSGMVAATFVLTLTANPAACELPSGTAVQLSGVFQPGNLSGVCRVGEFLVIGTDEGELKDGVDTRKVQVLRRDGTRYVHAHDVPLKGEGTTEIDVEGIACEDRDGARREEAPMKDTRAAAGDCARPPWKCPSANATTG